MNIESNGSPSTHVLMLPWSAFGHLIPFLELSIAIAKKGIKVTFISTPGIIQRLPKIPENLKENLKFAPLKLAKLENSTIPESAEASVDIPVDKIDHLKQAVDGLQEQVRQFVSENRVDWIIVDFFHHWAVDIAREFDDIPVVRFQVVTGSTTVAFNKHGNGSKVSYKKHEEKIKEEIVECNESGISDQERTMKIDKGCRAVAIRTCLEFELDSVKENEKFLSKPVLPVGFLPPEKITSSALKDGTGEDDPFHNMFQWLDQNEPKSVLFVGFGSECKLTKTQVHEIANGIELSGLPFIWALRKPEWAQDDESILLPTGFIERTKNTGLIHMGWVPQRRILAHWSIGCCLFHAGWGSIIESLQYGHCLTFLPFVVDQPLNARLMVQKGLGVEVERSEEDGSFSGESVAMALRTAMSSEEMRKKAAEVSRDDGVFGNEKLHDSYVERFVEYLRSEQGKK